MSEVGFMLCHETTLSSPKQPAFIFKTANAGTDSSSASVGAVSVENQRLMLGTRKILNYQFSKEVSLQKQQTIFLNRIKLEGGSGPVYQQALFAQHIHTPLTHMPKTHMTKLGSVRIYIRR
ncbi:hypothetical protein RJ639_042737 [Escallonia herrerae]|uniref:Uncharacterized protein n=1 Tax=Escallonia herrerae TaxID=1293975 RepID=A0AA88WA16_9ASTE|nr:hypothetical protein RJ639_042737 [Escallonia herrerae]